MASDNGGPAFPVECSFGTPIQGVQTGNTTGWVTGLTILDYFAGQVLPSIVGNPIISNGVREMKANAIANEVTATDFEINFEFPMYANAAYGIAAAMLAEKQKRETT